MKKDKKQEHAAQDDCAQCQEYLAGWKRALADYDNVQKDLARARGDMRRQAVADAIDGILPVLDNFDQAVKFTPEGLTGQAAQWLSGILHVRTQLETALQDLGVEPVGMIGEPFDAARHDAAGERHDPDQSEGAVLEVVQRGWAIGDHLLRPARVIVSA
jgi:molecular chaperone GrpE